MLDDDEVTGEITLARRGVAALVTLKGLPDGTTEVTAEQRRVLAGWGGWGPLAKALGNDGTGNAWYEIRNHLHTILSYPARETARNACDTAFYTPRTVVRGMWDLAAALGFTGGTALEPGCG